jgi:hypothetical protein
MLGIIEVRITVDKRSASLILLKRWYDLLRSDLWEDFNEIYTENYSSNTEITTINTIAIHNKINVGMSPFAYSL